MSYSPTLSERPIAADEAISCGASNGSAQRVSYWLAVALQLTITLAAGLLHAIGWVFPGAWAPVWIGQAAFIWLGVFNTPRRAFWWGTLGGTVGIAVSFYWGIQALNVTIDASPVLAWLLFSVLVLFEGLSLGLFCLGVATVRKKGVQWLWLVPFLWTAIEYWYPRLFPWQTAYSQLEFTPLIQISELVGSVGVGFVLTAVAAIPALVAACRRAGDRNNRSVAAWYSAGAVALLAATLLFGIVRSRHWEQVQAGSQRLKVGLVQVDPAYQGSEEKLTNCTLPLGDKVDLVCWPESAIGVYSEKLTHFRDRERTLELSRGSQLSLEIGKDIGAYVLAGGKLYGENSGNLGPFAMTAFLVSPEDDILGRYKKRTLLPFGEYVPGESWFPTVREWFTLHEFIYAGSDPRPLQTLDGKQLGMLICYEDTLPRSARHTVAAGAQALFSLIQGTAFHNPLTLRQHMRLAAMRAVENRRYFVRCASTGVTCIIDPMGRIVSQLPVQTEGTLVGEIALIDAQSLYTRIGDLFPWCCTAVVAAALWMGRRKGSVAAESR